MLATIGTFSDQMVKNYLDTNLDIFVDINTVFCLDLLEQRHQFSKSTYVF
jgi:hypothetical protein